MKDVVLLNLRISMWGISRTLGDHDYEVDADKSMTRASKKILQAPEYEFLLSEKRLIHRRLKAMALPGDILRAGIYPISIAMVDAVDQALQEFSVRWEVGVDQLGEFWSIRVGEISDKLQGLYREDDYPTWEKAKGQFEVKWSYFTMDTPDSLEKISAGLLQREKQKARAEWAQMLDDIKGGLRVAFKQLVDGLVDKLTPNPDGTKKRLIGVDRLMDFVNTFAKQNVAGDTDLVPLVEEAKALLEGQDIDSLRKDQGLRDYALERMSSVKVVLDGLVTDAPTRQIVLRD